MSYGKYEKKGKPLAFLTVTLIVLLVLVCSFSGVAAYLAKGPANNAVNSFEAAQPLNAQVVVQDGKYCVDVGDPGYAVYVRAAVIPNWKQDGSVILTAPDNFTITPGEDWVKHTDGFFYYTKPISSGLTSHQKRIVNMTVPVRAHFPDAAPIHKIFSNFHQFLVLQFHCSLPCLRAPDAPAFSLLIFNLCHL